MAAPGNVQAATLEKFLEAWKNGKAEDTMSLWSDDFKQRLLPLSLGTQTASRAQAELIYPKLVGALTNWKVRKLNTFMKTRKLLDFFSRSRV